jgi:hypothetical protein
MLTRGENVCYQQLSAEIASRYTVRVIHKTLLTLFLSLPIATGFAQSTPGDDMPIAAASAVSCEDKGANSSKTVKSRLGFTASVEVRAVRQSEGKEQRCLTSWILQVSGPDGSSTPIEVQSREDKPNDNEWGYENSFEIIGWSQDGARLLAAAVMAGGDWDETTPVVYDFQQRKWWCVELAPLFKKVVSKDCLVYFRPMGFTATGEAVILVGPFDDGQRCFRKSRWALDYEKQTVRQIRNAK